MKSIVQMMAMIVLKRMINSLIVMHKNFEIEIDNSDFNSDAKYSLNSNDMISVNIIHNTSIGVNIAYTNSNLLSVGGASTISVTSDAKSISSNQLQKEDISREASPEFLTETLALCQEVQSVVTLNAGTS
ncbi:hypothetical protein ACF0H5_011944 [Mactra antiquata]